MVETDSSDWMDRVRVKITDFRLWMNIGLFIAYMLFSIGMIQHAVFFYSFPPDFSRWLNIHPMAYIILSVILFSAAKIEHLLLEMGAVVREK